MKTINNPDQEQAIIAQIQNLMKELQKCAPHPDKPEQSGPMFLQHDANHALPADYDGMLGSMMMESMLGSAFGTAASELGSTIANNMDKMAEAASTYMQDRTPKSIKIGGRRVIANDFNTTSARGPEYLAQMEAFMADLPARLHLEKWLAHETRRLYALRKNAPMPMPAPLAA